MVRIGRITYANCTPVFHALTELYPEAGYEYAGGVPSRLNTLLAAAEIDVCPSSSIEFARHPDRYLIIPDISISSCGPVQSVLLFSSVPMEELDGRLVLLSSESATSVNLLKIILKMRYGLDCTFRATNLGLEGALGEAPAVLLIGDPALRAAQAAAAVHVHDLGDIWYRWTGKPFVFALWFATREALARNGDELRAFARNLLKAKEYALRHLEHIANVSPDAGWMGEERLLTYWRSCLSYDLGDDHIAGLTLFYRYAEELALIGKAPELAFLEP